MPMLLLLIMFLILLLILCLLLHLESEDAHTVPADGADGGIWGCGDYTPQASSMI